MNMYDRRKTLATSLLSLARVETTSFNVVSRNSMPNYHVAIVTAGDDTQGMNAAIRASARTGFYMGCRVSFIKQGFKGMVDGGDNFEDATWNSTSDIIGMGGTMLKSYKCPEFLERAGRLKAAKNLVNYGIQAIVAIGGDGTLKGLNILYNEWFSLLEELAEKGLVDKIKTHKCRHLKIVCILASITNEIANTDLTIGVNSALHRIVESIDAISSTSSSSQLAFVVQVMGGTSGYLALVSGLISDASMIFVPEWPPEGNWRDELCDKVKDDIYLGSEGILCITCDGAIDREGHPITPEEIRDTLQNRLNLNAKITILGHVQRGGNPTAIDRTIGSRMGVEAISCLKDIPEEDGPSVITIRGNTVVCYPMTDVIENTRKIEESLRERNFAELIRRRGKQLELHLNNYTFMHNLRSNPVACVDIPGARKIGVVRLGRSTVNQCMVVRTIVAFCHHKSVVVLNFKNGFAGLADGEYNVLCWEKVKNWTSRQNVCLDSSVMNATEVGLERIAEQLENLGVSGLVLIGNFEAYKSLADIHEAKARYRGLCIPICMVPVTMINNIPGSVSTIGSDTTLNEIIQYCDKIKRVARDQNNRVFIIETMGQNCGYLPTLSAMCVGADAAYIKQEHFDLNTLLEDADHLRSEILHGNTSVGLIICGERVDENYNTEFINRLFSEQGKGVYTCRANTIGHVQQGGLPSVMDRALAGAAGLKTGQWIFKHLDKTSADNILKSDRSESRTVLCCNRYKMTFVPISSLITETDFAQKLPTFMAWMKWRPIIRILARHEARLELDFMMANEEEEESTVGMPVDT
ncbi:hypothetical protein BsWGS_17982 [Bradybaena similaris]